MTRPSRGRILVLFGNVPMYGQERENIETIDHLRAAGWEALFVVHPEWSHLNVVPELDARGIPWVKVRFADRFDRGIGFAGWLRRLRDIVVGSWQLLAIARAYRPTHVHLGNAIWFVDFMPALALLRIPIVFRVGDVPAQHRFLFRALWRVIGLRTTRFVAISKFIREILSEATGRPEKVALIYGVPPARPRARAIEMQKPPGAFVFAFAGQVAEHKGVRLIVDAALSLVHEFPEARFLFAGGDGDGALVRDLRERIDAVGASDRIRFVGFIEDVPGLLALADVHLCPTVCEEALGVTVLEAKAAGIPSVVFASGGLTELVADGVDGTVCREKTASALRDACRGYLVDPSRAHREGEAAHASLSRYGAGRYQDPWAEVYEAC